MLKLVTFPNDLLRQRIPEFDFTNKDVDPIQLEKDMLEFMYKSNGIGLAANQVGLKIRMFVMGHKDSPELGQAFYNPTVLENTDTIRDLEEGCLSFPDIFVKIKRPTAIKARWQTSKGEFKESIFSGYDCKCFLHELDHLEGIVFKDRVSSLKWTLAVKRK